MESQRPSQDVLKKIKEENISPKSYFQVYWKNYVFWIAWGVIMIFGAISFSMLLLNVLDIRPEFLRVLGVGHYLRLLMETAPYLWIILVFIAVGTGYFAMRKTRTGYRYNMIFITTIIVLMISMLGVLLHLSKFDRHVGERMTHNQRISEIGFPARERLSRPGDGTIGGRIISISEGEIIIENLQGNTWTILYNKKTKIDLRKKIEVGMHIAVIGKKIDKGIFKADSILKLPKNLRFEKRDVFKKPPVPQDERK